MKFFDFFIQRPLLAVLLNSLLVIYGVSSFFYLEMRHFPKVEKQQTQQISPEPSEVTKALAFTPPPRQAVHLVYRALAIAVLSVMIALVLLLGRWQDVVIPALTVPMCLIAAFGVMHLFQFSVDIVTLLALVFAVGLVVDDAIVWIDNIQHYVRRDLALIEAIRHGTREIGLPLIGMTITLAAVYVPFGLMDESWYHLLRSFGWTLAGAVLISGFITLTLAPALYAQFMSEHKRETNYRALLDDAFEMLAQRYRAILKNILSVRWLVIVLLVGLALVGYWVYSTLPVEFMNATQQGGLLAHHHILLVMALLGIYLVLTAQFGNFIDPWVILFSVPLCIVSAIIALKLINGSINVYTVVGLVTLIGLITKHGVLVVHFGNKFRKKGYSIDEAIIESSVVRLRPILITTVAMILAAIPFLLFQGLGMSHFYEIGWIFISGLAFGTFFSLIVVPVGYTYLSQLKRFL